MIFSSFVYSCINVNKTSNVTIAKTNEAIEIKIFIENKCEKDKEITIVEDVFGDVIYPRENLVFYNTSEKVFIWRSPQLIWKNINLEANQKISISYVIYFDTVDKFVIPPTKVLDESGNVYNSNSIEIKIECNRNGMCEKMYAENYVNCPEDCKVSSEDGICSGYVNDPDCKTQIKTEEKKEENFLFYVFVISLIVLSVLLVLYRFVIRKTLTKS